MVPHGVLHTQMVITQTFWIATPCDLANVNSGENILTRKDILQKEKGRKRKNKHIYACLIHVAYSIFLGKGAHVVNSDHEEKLNKHCNLEPDKRQYGKTHTAEDFTTSMTHPTCKHYFMRP